MLKNESCLTTVIILLMLTVKLPFSFYLVHIEFHADLCNLSVFIFPLFVLAVR
jgi:hypothetical protein